MPLSKIDSDSLNSGVPTRAQLPAGTVLQVVSNTVTAQPSFALNNTFSQATDLNTIITPSSASNKVLVRVVINFGEDGNGAYPAFRLTKNGSEITAARGATAGSRKTVSSAGGNMPSNSIVNCVGVEFLDSPATTSAVTYGVQVTGFSSRTFYINLTGNSDGNAGMAMVSTVTLMEIAA